MAAKSGRNPAGRTAAPVAQAPAKSDADVFAGLTITAETEPLPKGTRDTGPNVFEESVLASNEEGAPAFGATVPEADVKRAVYLIRKAARLNGLGVRIIEDAPVNGNVKLRYKAKPKKQRRTDTASA